MKPVRGVITAVDKGKVTVLLTSGAKVKFKTDKTFSKYDSVLVLFDFHSLSVRDILPYSECYKEDDPAPEPECDESEDLPVVEESEEGGSSPLPAVAFEEWFLEGEV